MDKKYTDAQYERLKEHLRIENFKNNPCLNGQYLKEIKVLKEHNFVRSGKTGGWKDYFDDELNAKADEWIRKNIKDTDIEFPIGYFN